MKMHKLVGSIVALSLIMTPVLASAETAVTTSASTSTNVQIQALLTQIQTLQAQIQALKTAQTQLASTSASVYTSVQLLRSMKEGMSGDDIAALQAILASDPTIFPNGTVDGVFGSTTREALKKFQRKHGIDSLGYAGPKTLKRLNQLLKELGVTKKNGEDKEFCVKVPPGHLIAPGLFKTDDNGKKTGKFKFRVVDCSKLPNANDTTAPTITGLGTSNLLGTSTNIVWNTNETSNSKIWYATSSPVTTTGTPNNTNGNYVTTHSISLSGLATSTTYYYVVTSADSTGNTATSSQGSFVTTAGL